MLQATPLIKLCLLFVNLLQTREKLAIPARKAVSFTPGKNLKEEVNGAPSKPAKVAAPKAAAAPAAPAAPKAAAAPKKAAPKK